MTFANIGIVGRKIKGSKPAATPCRDDACQGLCLNQPCR